MTEDRQPSTDGRRAAGSGRVEAPAHRGPFSEDWRLAGVILAVAVTGLALLPGRWVLFHPVLMGAVMLRLWWRRGRDPEKRTVAPRYEPPDGLSPAEVGILVDHTLDMRDVTACLADLAHRGYLRIEETTAPRAEASDGAAEGERRDYVFVRTSEPERWEEELASHEADLLYALFGDESLTFEDLSGISGPDVVSGLLRAWREQGPDVELDREEMSREEMFRHLLGGRAEGGALARELFGEGRERIRMSELEDSFYLVVGVLHEGFLARLDERGYYHGLPGGRRGIYVLAGVGTAGLMWYFGGEPVSVFAGLLSGLVVSIVGWMMPARTLKGARALAQARGFREFLDQVEEDRFRRMIESPAEFEAYLPYAVALGVDDRWAEAFASLYSQPDRRSGGGGIRIEWSGLREDFREEARRHGVEG